MKPKPKPQRRRSDSSVVETKSADHFGDGFSYVRRLVACGKSRCRVCGGVRYRHGPYWYAVRWSPEKRRRRGDLSADTRPTVGRYVGRELRPVDSPKPPPLDRGKPAKKKPAPPAPPAPPARPAAAKPGTLRQALSKKPPAAKPAKKAKPPAKKKKPAPPAPPAAPAPVDRTREARAADLALWTADAMQARIDAEAEALQADEGPPEAEDVDDVPVFTFAKRVPAEVRELVQGLPFNVRAMVRAIQPGQPGYAAATGADYFSKVGEERFVRALKRYAGGRAERARAVLKAGRASGEVLAALLTLGGCAVSRKKGEARVIDPAKVKKGDRWAVCGVQVEAVCDGPAAVLNIRGRRVGISDEPMPVDAGSFAPGRGVCRTPKAKPPARPAPAPF